MNKKITIFMISIILTIIFFSISTIIQKRLVNDIPMQKCISVINDIEAYEKIEEEDIKYIDMPVLHLQTINSIKNFSEVKDLYLKDKIYTGQILVKNQFDTEQNLKIYRAELGKEKIAIKIKSAENGVAFTIRKNSKINVYATMRNEYAKDFMLDKKIIGTENEGYSVIKLLNGVKVLGIFQSDGNEVEENLDREIDSILIAVSEEEAKNINLIREIATFNCTELGEENLEKEKINENNI